MKCRTLSDDLLKWPDLTNQVFRTQAKHSLPDDSTDPLDGLGVPALRYRAADKGLEVDVSRKTLVKRLKIAENEN